MQKHEGNTHQKNTKVVKVIEDKQGKMEQLGFNYKTCDTI